MRLRIDERLWKSLSDGNGFIREVEKILGGGDTMLFPASTRFTGAGGIWYCPSITEPASGLKLILGEEVKSDCDYLIIAFFQSVEGAEKYDRERGLTGRRVEDKLSVLPPEQAAAQKKPMPKPASESNAVAVVVKRKEYRELSEHLKIQLNMAWTRLLTGRQSTSVAWKGDVIFLLTPIDGAGRISGPEELQRMEDALADAGIGRTINDTYEIKRIREMAAGSRDIPV